MSAAASGGTLGERLATKWIEREDPDLVGLTSWKELASLIDTDEEVKRLAALEREADNRDEMEAMIAQRYCEHIKLLDAKVERLVADKERAIQLLKETADRLLCYSTRQKPQQKINNL